MFFLNLGKACWKEINWSNRLWRAHKYVCWCFLTILQNIFHKWFFYEQRVMSFPNCRRCCVIWYCVSSTYNLRIWINKMYKRQQHITNTTKNSSTKTDINIVSITSILFCNVFFYKRNADVLNIFNTHLLSNSNVPQDFFFRFICKSSMHDFKCNYIWILICNSVV